MKLGKVLRYAVVLGIGVALFALAFRGLDWQSLWQSLRTVKAAWLIPAVVVMLLSHLVRALRWNLLIHPLGANPTAFNSMTAVMTGYLANTAVPRLGEVTRCVLLSRTDKIPVQSLFGTVISERVIDLITLLVLLAINIVLESKLLLKVWKDQVLAKFSSSSGGGMGNSIILIGIIAAIVSLILGLIIWRRIRDTDFGQKISGTIRGFRDGILSVARMRQRSLFLAYTALLWILYGLVLYLLFKSFAPTAGLGMVAALSVLVIGSFGMVMPVPGGIGAYHFAASIALMLYGIGREDSLGFAFMAHGMQTLVIIVFGALFYFLMTLRTPKVEVAKS